MENASKPSRIAMIIIAIMTIASFTNLFRLNLSSIAIILGVVFFFLDKRLEQQPMSESGLDVRAISANLKDKRIWIWFMLPIIVDAICVSLAIVFVPEYIKYETARAGSFVAIELSVSSILLFFVFALGEEIAWRAFFQNKISKVMSFAPALLITSLLFTLGHYTHGSTKVVLFGLIFTFINSLLYGVIFKKTNNAWISTIAHFAANIFEVSLFVAIGQ